MFAASLRSLRLRSSLAAVVGSLALSATPAFAQEKPAEGAAKPKTTFQDHVQAIFREHCNTCHSADTAKGGLALDTYAATMRGGAGGEVVFAGDLDSSRLWALVSHLETPKMPPEQDKLAEAKLSIIKSWILEGALENSGSKIKKSNKPSLELKVTSGSDNKPTGAPAMPEGLIPEPVIVTSRAGAITAMAASPWAPLVAVAGQKQILLYHTDTYDLLGVLPFPEGVPHVLKFSRNGSILLAGGGRGAQAGKVILFDVKSGKRVTEIGDELDVVLAADIDNDHQLVALGGPRKVVRVFSVETGELVSESRKHTDWVYSIEFSPDGVLMASTDRSGGVVVFESETGREFQALVGHKAGVTDVSWRIDSNMLATASEDNAIKLWEMENGKEVKSWSAHDGAGVQSVEFCRNGNLVSVGRNKTTRLWGQDGKLIRAFDGLTDIGTEVAVTFDNKRIIAGDSSGQVRVWNAEDGKLLTSLIANPPTIAGWVDLEVTNLAAQEKLLTDADNAVKAATAAVASAKQSVDFAIKAAEDAKRLEGDRAKVDQRLAAAQAGSKKWTDGVKAAKADLDKQTQKVDALKKAAADKLAALKKLKETKDADKGALDKAQKESDQAAQEVTAQTNALKGLDAKHEEARQQLKKADEERAAADKARSDWSTALNAAKQATPKSKADLDKLQANRETTEKNLATAKAALDGAKSTLEATKARLQRVKELKALQDKTRTAQASAK